MRDQEQQIVNLVVLDDKIDKATKNRTPGSLDDFDHLMELKNQRFREIRFLLIDNWEECLQAGTLPKIKTFYYPTGVDKRMEYLFCFEGELKIRMTVRTHTCLNRFGINFTLGEFPTAPYFDYTITSYGVDW